MGKIVLVQLERGIREIITSPSVFSMFDPRRSALRLRANIFAERMDLQRFDESSYYRF